MQQSVRSIHSKSLTNVSYSMPLFSVFILSAGLSYTLFLPNRLFLSEPFLYNNLKPICMNSRVRIFFIALYFILQSASLLAQKKSSNYEVGAALGGFVYQGDLTPDRFGSLKTIRPGLILHGSRKLNSTLALRLNLSFASLKGDDAKYNTPAFRQQRNFNFRTPVIEVMPQIVWNPLGWDDVGKKISPYAFGGAGFSILHIKRDWSNFNVGYFESEPSVISGLAIDAAHKTPRVAGIISVGAGIRYSISPQIVLNAEGSYRILFTDYLDGFSRAADAKLKDHYYSISVGVIYRFGKKNSWDCPTVR